MRIDYKKIFQRGLIAIAPLALTIALIGWICSTIESVFGAPLKAFLGDKLYFPGVGIVFFILITFILGTILNSILAQKIYRIGEDLLTKIPLVKTLYNSLRELMSYFKDEEKKKIGQVVRVEIAGTHMLGLVTREEFEGLPEAIADKGDVAVFLPMSYQIGGYTILVPKERITKLDMSVEEAMRFSITAGALSQKSPSNKG